MKKTDRINIRVSPDEKEKLKNIKNLSKRVREFLKEIAENEKID